MYIILYVNLYMYKGRKVKKIVKEGKMRRHQEKLKILHVESTCMSIVHRIEP